MGVIKHSHNCKFVGQNVETNWNAEDKTCRSYDFKEWVPHIAPDIAWYDIQDAGSYQGSVYGVGLYKKQIVIYEDYYGSCSGCGAWGEGGEPTSQKEVLDKSKLFKKKEDALKHVATLDHWDKPDFDQMFKAIDETKVK